MTPTALTPAARKAAAAKRAATAAKDPGAHTRRVHRGPSPAAPRRVSGPVSRSTAPTRPAPSRPAARPSPQRSASPRPRPQRSPRVAPGGTSRRVMAALAHVRALPGALNPTLPRRRATATRRQPVSGPLGVRIAARVRTMPEHVIIDRLVRGRAWIPVLGVMLAGIVFTQVEILKLGAGIGRSVQQTSVLSARNQQLRASVATLGDDQRIESMAAQMGMIMPAPTAVGFLNGPGDLQQALTNLIAPSTTRFLNAPSSNGGLALGTDLASTGTSTAGAITMSPSGQASTVPTPITPAAGTSSASSGGASTAATSTPASASGAPATGTTATSGTPATGTTGASGTGTAGTPTAPSAGTTAPAATAPSTTTGGVALGTPSQTTGG